MLGRKLTGNFSGKNKKLFRKKVKKDGCEEKSNKEKRRQEEGDKEKVDEEERQEEDKEEGKEKEVILSFLPYFLFLHPLFFEIRASGNIPTA